MPVVHSSLVIPHVPLHQVWDAVADFEAYPETMPDVLEVAFLDRAGDTASTSWRVLLNGSELTWTERDEFEPYERIVFDQIEGDLEVFRGEWRLRETQEGVEVALDVEFDLGIPSLAPVLDPIGTQAIQANARSMLSAIRETVS